MSSARPSSIWVGSFSDDTKREELEEAFSRYGKILSCEIKIQSNATGESRYAFVNFEEEHSADDALEDKWVELPSGTFAMVAPAKRKGADKAKGSKYPPQSRPRHPPTDCTFFLMNNCRSGDKVCGWLDASLHWEMYCNTSMYCLRFVLLPRSVRFVTVKR